MEWARETTPHARTHTRNVPKGLHVVRADRHPVGRLLAVSHVHIGAKAMNTYNDTESFLVSEDTPSELREYARDNMIDYNGGEA